MNKKIKYITKYYTIKYQALDSSTWFSIGPKYETLKRSRTARRFYIKTDSKAQYRIFKTTITEESVR